MQTNRRNVIAGYKAPVCFVTAPGFASKMMSEQAARKLWDERGGFTGGNCVNYAGASQITQARDAGQDLSFAL